MSNGSRDFTTVRMRMGQVLHGGGIVPIDQQATAFDPDRGRRCVRTIGHCIRPLPTILDELKTRLGHGRLDRSTQEDQVGQDAVRR